MEMEEAISGKMENGGTEPQTEKAPVVVNGTLRPKVKVNNYISNNPKWSDGNRGVIDTDAPFQSVKAAVSKFGGITEWKAHKQQSFSKKKDVEHELEKVQDEIPVCRRLSEIAEDEKMQALKELDGTRRQIEELKLNLGRAQTEEDQAKQDSELAKLRMEEMERGIGEDASVAAKAQLEVAKARHSAAISELKSVKEELEALVKEYSSLVTEKNVALAKANESLAVSKEAEKAAEGLTIELIITKKSLESAHVAHLEVEEQRLAVAMAREQDSVRWEKELKHAEEELQKIHQEIVSTKDLKSKVYTASSLLCDLKAELASCMESISKERCDQVVEDSPKKSNSDLLAAVASAKHELEEVKGKLKKANVEINSLKEEAASLQAELEEETSALSAVKLREETAFISVGSLKDEVENTRSELALVEKEQEVGDKMVELPLKLQKAAKEADEVKSLSQIAREELRKAQEQADEAKAGATSMETKLLAAQKEIQAARASEKLALAVIKALQESGEVGSPGDQVKLSAEEYYGLSKQANEAEEQAHSRVASAISEIEEIKESEMKSLEKLEELNRDMELRKKDLEIANEKAEKAKEGKLGAEQELRVWRARREHLRKDGGSVREVTNPKKGPSMSLDGGKMLMAVSISSASRPKGNGSEGYARTNSLPDGKMGKKKPFLPRVLTFFSRKKSRANKSS